MGKVKESIEEQGGLLRLNLVLCWVVIITITILHTIARAKLSDNLTQTQALLDESVMREQILQTELDIYREQADHMGTVIELLEEILELQTFSPYDELAISPDIQEYAYHTAMYLELDPDILFATLYTESGGIWHEPVMDTNGYRSVGYMMINEIVWEDMLQLGIDVHTEKGNILAGALILSQHIDTHGELRGLAAYNCGVAGMLRGGGVTYAQTVQQRSLDFC